MSATLVWQIKPTSRYKGLPIQLRYILEKKWCFPKVVDLSDIPYFQGLNDAGIEGAEELIDIIKQFIEIELNIEV